MSAYIRPVGAVSGHYSTAEQPFVVKNGTTITTGDFVTIDSTGHAIPTASTGRIVGTAAGTVVGDGVKTVIVLVDPLTLYLVEATTALTIADVGSYFNLQGGTGAQLVNASSLSTTSGQLVCVNFNPQIDPVRNDATWGLFTVSQSFFAVA